MRPTTQPTTTLRRHAALLTALVVAAWTAGCGPQQDPEQGPHGLTADAGALDPSTLPPGERFEYVANPKLVNGGDFAFKPLAKTTRPTTSPKAAAQPPAAPKPGSPTPRKVPKVRPIGGMKAIEARAAKPAPSAPLANEPATQEPARATDASNTEAPISLTASDGTGLELRALESRTVIDGPLAFTELRLRFHNPEDRQREGRFAITLPPKAGISRFAMRIRGAWMEGEVVEKQRARRVYEDFLHRRQDPAILEQDAGNTFRARVFPIPAKGDKELVVAFSQELADPSQPVRLPLRGLGKLADLKLRSFVHTGKPGDRFRVVHFAHIVRKDHAPQADLLIYPDRAGERAAALRHANIAVARVRAKGRSAKQGFDRVVVLFDTSASQAVNFAERTQRLRQLVQFLGDEGARHVQVLAFDQNQTQVYSGAPAGFGAAQVAQLQQRAALGGSNLEAALTWAKGAVQGGARVVLFGNGVATLGARESGQLGAVAKTLAEAGATRLDTVTLTTARDMATLRAVATAGLADDGVHVQWRASGAQEDDEVHAALAPLARGTLKPVNVAVTGAGWVWPTTLRGLQDGEHALVYAEVPAGEELEIALTGGMNATLKPQTEVAVEPLVRRAWVRARIALLLAAEAGDDPDAKAKLRKEALRLSVKHRVLCELTALLVLETERDYRRYGIDRKALADILTVTPEGAAVTRSRAALQRLLADGRVAGADNAEAEEGAKERPREKTDHKANQDSAEPPASASGPTGAGSPQAGAEADETEPGETEAPAPAPEAKPAPTQPTSDPEARKRNARRAVSKKSIAGFRGSGGVASKLFAESGGANEVIADRFGGHALGKKAKRRGRYRQRPRPKKPRRPMTAAERKRQAEAAAKRSARRAADRAKAEAARAARLKAARAAAEAQKVFVALARGAADHKTALSPRVDRVLGDLLLRGNGGWQRRQWGCVATHLPLAYGKAVTVDVQGLVDPSGGVRAWQVSSPLPKLSACLEAGLLARLAQGAGHVAPRPTHNRGRAAERAAPAEGLTAFSRRYVFQRGAMPTAPSAAPDVDRKALDAALAEIEAKVRKAAAERERRQATQRRASEAWALRAKPPRHTAEHLARDRAEVERKVTANPAVRGHLKAVHTAIAANDTARALQLAWAKRHASATDVVALVALGDALLAAGDKAQAARAYGSLIDLFPSRADLRRFAGNLVEQAAGTGDDVAVDIYQVAVSQRADHPAGHHMLAMALAARGRYLDALDAALVGLRHPRRGGNFRMVDRILEDDMAIIARAALASLPAKRLTRQQAQLKAAVLERLYTRGLKPDSQASLRFILTWETDANDVDFHIFDRADHHAYYGRRPLPEGVLFADITTGYGPECFRVDAPRAYPYQLMAHYFRMGPMGYGMGRMQILRHDGRGGLGFESRPYTIMADKSWFHMGRVTAETAAVVQARPAASLAAPAAAAPGKPGI